MSQTFFDPKFKFELTHFINSELFMIYIQTHPKVVHIYSNAPDALNIDYEDCEDFIYFFVPLVLAGLTFCIREAFKRKTRKYNDLLPIGGTPGPPL